MRLWNRMVASDGRMIRLNPEKPALRRFFCGLAGQFG